ncbi:MAG: type I methionyl aminopeptidase [Gemmatimonadota bacterium]|nr:type I methionyl aminopeptidase [Gemmatimonadota bacterium]MDQ8152689.1 type I methionyl aminopeptidase [Gemmatimonadota bacterium]MDQ8169236.1 type I methionyl aminopeptidase [Gemmatimonadota bacterium]MDQ8178537.1 type I methionyl aminopeptidase [Gemmatimonadota bacterium]
MIHLKSPREIETMAAGGRILAATHRHIRSAIAPGITTLEIDALVEGFIRSHAGATPSFKGLYGFPASACISINDEIVHGIPSPRRILAAGDIVTVDIGVHYGGLHTDSAWTYPVGEIRPETQRLLDVTERSLYAGIQAARVGNHIGDIGHAVEEVVTRARYTVVRDLVGHGVGTSMHEEPQVPNHGKPKRGAKLQAGMTIAIEPMVNAGGAATRTLADKWTIVTLDGSLSAHFEHTIAITAEGPRILTTLD